MERRDPVVPAESAELGSVEATVGLHRLMGAVQRAGAARAKEMAMLRRRYDAPRLERWNVINRVVEDEQLDAAAMTLAGELAGGPTVAHAATKALVSIAVCRGVAAADEARAELEKPIFRSDDSRAGGGVVPEQRPGDGLPRGTLTMSGPLTGTGVLDFSRVLAGPHCGRTLLDLGAGVIV